MQSSRRNCIQIEIRKNLNTVWVTNNELPKIPISQQLLNLTGLQALAT